MDIFFVSAICVIFGFVLFLPKYITQLKNYLKEFISLVGLAIRIITGKQKKIKKLIKKYDLPNDLKKKNLSSVKIIKKEGILTEDLDGNIK